MLTLITSLYKSEKYLKNYLKSVIKFAQYFQSSKIKWELIIIINSPSEKEREIISALKKYNWINYLEVDREPLYATWNRGIKMARYNNIGFWNVDDIRHPRAAVDGLKLLEQGADLVYFPFTIKWRFNILSFSVPIKKKDIKPIHFNKENFGKGMHCGPFFIFKKSLYQQVGPFDEQFKIAGDFDWCVRASKKTDKFSLSAFNGGLFRVDGQGLSAGSKKRFILENNIVLARHHLPYKLEGFNQEEISKFEINQLLYNNKFINF
jgi:GT2 family glycosyltransferase